MVQITANYDAILVLWSNSKMQKHVSHSISQSFILRHEAARYSCNNAYN